MRESCQYAPAGFHRCSPVKHHADNCTSEVAPPGTPVIVSEGF